MDRSRAIDDLFYAFDLDGNHSVGFHELLQIVEAVKRVGSRQHAKWIAQLQAQIHQAQETSRRSGVASQVHLKGGGHVHFMAGTHGEPSLDPKAFAEFIESLTKNDTDEEFDEFCELVQKSVLEAKESTQGNAFKRLAWDIFQLLDANRDGEVDFKEFSQFFNATERGDKKALLRWAHMLNNRMKNSQQTQQSQERHHSGSDDEEEVHLQLPLADFQQFIHEYTEGDQERLAKVHAAVLQHVEEKHKAYIAKMRVDEIFSAITSDLLRERPHDVLQGIIRSAERLQRSGQYRGMRYRSGSMSNAASLATTQSNVQVQ